MHKVAALNCVSRAAAWQWNTYTHSIRCRCASKMKPFCRDSRPETAVQHLHMQRSLFGIRLYANGKQGSGISSHIIYAGLLAAVAVLQICINFICNMWHGCAEWALSLTFASQFECWTSKAARNRHQCAGSRTANQAKNYIYIYMYIKHIVEKLYSTTSFRTTRENRNEGHPKKKGSKIWKICLATGRASRLSRCRLPIADQWLAIDYDQQLDSFFNEFARAKCHDQTCQTDTLSRSLFCGKKGNKWK